MTVFRKHLALRELRDNIRDRDPIKARLVLDHFHEFSAMEQAWVIEALAECGDDFALPLLVALAGRDEATDLRIIDVFAGSQDEFSLHKLNELLRSRSLIRRNYCKKKLVEIGSKCVPLLIENLSGNDSGSVIDSLHILRELGDKTARFPVRQLINSHPRNANVRFAAYETLANLPRLKGDYVLASGLADPVENVRITAARAIDHNLDEVLVAGISNMINRQDEEARWIVKAILDGQAGRIFLALLDQEHFRSTARAYLVHKAHPEIRDFFAGLLARHGDHELAAGIRTGAAPDEAAPWDKVCAVDDSRMILNVYRAVLNELNFAPVLFQEPKKALAWLKEERPLLICTDLNMPEMTGLDFIRNIRTLYSKEELPVVLVTTQDDRKDNEEAMGAGANAVLRKPFDAAGLAAVLMQVFGDR
ncbi:MAG: response regulator [Pseudomonadota bacterium]